MRGLGTLAGNYKGPRNGVPPYFNHWLYLLVVLGWVGSWKMDQWPTAVCYVCNRYALDWLHSEGVVRVLCGSQSQITCTLKLHDDYPSVSCVTLQSATGLPPDFNLDTIQVSVTSALHSTGSRLESFCRLDIFSCHLPSCQWSEGVG